MKTIFVLTILAAAAVPAYAVDGVVLINQNNALAGSVTPGDTPGFPVTISVSGSYRLSSNLTVPDANTTAIHILASDVTIDLNGFSIIGPELCFGFPAGSCSPTAFGNGIDSNQFQSRISVSNGTITGMGASGVSLPGANIRVEKVQAFQNGLIGITIPQSGEGSVSDCIAIYNGSDGISASRVSGSFARGNGRNGIAFNGADNVITDNVVDSNGSNGIEGQGSIIGNSATANLGDGIQAGCPSSIVANFTSGNKGFNIGGGGLGCVFANNVE